MMVLSDPATPGSVRGLDRTGLEFDMTDGTEEWRPVVGYEGLYEVSSTGRVASLRKSTRRLMKPSKTKASQGRLLVCFKVAGVQQTWGVHRLVALAFLGPRPEGMQICHGNGDCTDNRVENLRYGTVWDNAQDRIRHGRSMRGETNPNRKLTEDAVLQIRRSRAEGVEYRQLAEHFNVSQISIRSAIAADSWAWLEDDGRELPILGLRPLPSSQLRAKCPECHNSVPRTLSDKYGKHSRYGMNVPQLAEDTCVASGKLRLP